MKIINGDITKLKIDCIVNAANTSLLGGGGVDGCIHSAAGSELKEYCKTLNGSKTGEAKITPAFNLPAKYIIHTPGPIWSGGNHNEECLLQKCYYNSLNLAIENNIKSIAFPSISTGVYKFPFEKATKVAMKTIINFEATYRDVIDVFLIAYSETDYKEMLRIFSELKEQNT